MVQAQKGLVPPAIRHLTSPLAQSATSGLMLGDGVWWPSGAQLALDFAGGRYMAGGLRYAGFSDVPGCSVSRSTKAWGLTSDDLPIEAAADEALVIPLRGLLTEPSATRLNPQDLAGPLYGTGSNTTVTTIQTTLPDGTVGDAYRLQMPVGPQTFLVVAPAAASGLHSIQVWARSTGDGSLPLFALGAGGVPVEFSSSEQWLLYRLEQTATGQAPTINNRFDTFATDVMFVWPDVQQGPLASPILAPGMTASRAAASITVSDIDTQWALPPNHTFDVTYEDDTTASLSAAAGTLTIPVSTKAYRSIIG